jgi:ADP-ribose pyrophosphatase YjhB (NUDIX family)/O-acetyl-ADP-ribose deacetylase (regulator of RNase III)
MQELKIKTTVIKVIRADITKFKTQAVVIPNRSIEPGQILTTKDKLKRLVIYANSQGRDLQSCEDNLRKTCFNALKIASQKRLKTLGFSELNLMMSNFNSSHCAKVMAQEVLKHIKLDDSSLKQIFFVASDDKTFKIFKDIVFSYLDYIINKLSQGPFSTVDIIIEVPQKHSEKAIVLIERSNPPFGWAIPGGFVDYEESLEDTARREAKEETGLDIYDLKQFHVYSQPGRDPRFHTITTVFTAKAEGVPKADSDAKNIGKFTLSKIRKMKLAFDHNKVIEDYFKSTE